MIYSSDEMERQALLETAARMCAAARTAPKTRGADNIETLVLTGEEKNQVADRMDEIAVREFSGGGSFPRDARNVRAAAAIVLIGVRKAYAGLPFCSFCGFPSCADSRAAGARCAFNLIDLGIALGSAAAMAGDSRVDNRIMFSIGKAAQEMGFAEPEVLWHGIPLSITGKSVFFDRKQ